MNVHIAFEESTTEEDVYNLEQLAALIEDECNLAVKIERSEIQQGERDGGLAIGIAVVSLGLTAIQTLIGVLQYWESQKPKYSLSISINNQVFLIENLSRTQIEKVIKKLQGESPMSSIEVKILKKA